MPQLPVNSAVILFAATQAPAVAVPLLSVLFVVFAFAALRPTPAHRLVSWAGITVALAVVVSRSEGALAMPAGTPLEAALSTVWWSLVIGRCVLLGLYATREVDRIGRWGGEEFLLVLPACGDARTAEALAERLRGQIAAQPWHDLARGLSVTVSVGVAVARPGSASSELLARAVRALYRAKHAGRDRARVDD